MGKKKAKRDASPRDSLPRLSDSTPRGPAWRPPARHRRSLRRIAPSSIVYDDEPNTQIERIATAVASKMDGARAVDVRAWLFGDHLLAEDDRVLLDAARRAARLQLRAAGIAARMRDGQDLRSMFPLPIRWQAPTKGATVGTTPGERLLIELGPRGFQLDLEHAHHESTKNTMLWRRLSSADRAVIAFALSIDGYEVKIDLEDTFACMDASWRQRCIEALAAAFGAHGV